MKRLLLVFLCMAALVGCSHKNPPPSEITPPPENDDTVSGSSVEEESNPFLRAEVESRALSGGGWSRVATMEKSAAQEADADQYAAFVSEVLPSFRAELFGLIFDDGTGITYYGCDPSNAVYGKISYYRTSIEAHGVIAPNADGTYSYIAYSDTESNSDESAQK